MTARLYLSCLLARLLSYMCRAGAHGISFLHIVLRVLVGSGSYFDMGSHLLRMKHIMGYYS